MSVKGATGQNYYTGTQYLLYSHSNRVYPKVTIRFVSGTLRYNPVQEIYYLAEVESESENSASIIAEISKKRPLTLIH